MRTKVSAGDEIADRHLGGRRSDRNPYAASRHSRRAFSDVTESALHQLEHTSGRGLRDHDLSIGDDVASRRSTAHGIEFGCAITDDGDRIHVGKVGDRRDLVTIASLVDCNVDTVATCSDREQKSTALSFLFILAPPASRPEI